MQDVVIDNNKIAVTKHCGPLRGDRSGAERSVYSSGFYCLEVVVRTAKWPKVPDLTDATLAFLVKIRFPDC